MIPPDLLFVYGTLRADVRHPLNETIRRHARDLGPAVFQGRLYDLGAYPGVIDTDQPSELVYGELYEIVGDEDLLFERLDAYEECGPGFAEPTEYLRVVRSVRLQRPTGEFNDAVNAWIYIYNHPLRDARWVAHGDYLRRNES